MTFIAGGYTLTYNAKALGQLADGLRIVRTIFKRTVTGDLRGDTPQDGVYRGQDVQLAFTLMEANAAGVGDLEWPYSGTIGTAWDHGLVGLLDIRGQGSGSPVNRAKQLIATAVTGTSANNDGPTSLTMPYTIINENFPIDILYAPDLKEIPMRMRNYVNPSTAVFAVQA